MREPPLLALDKLTAGLQTHYGLTIDTLVFLPLGNDNDSAVYRAETAEGMAYFLKARTGAGFSQPSLAVPHHLHQQGIPHIAAPLATCRGELWMQVDDFALSLYPQIDGRTAVDAGLAADDWFDLGRTIKQIHSSPLTDPLRAMVRRESGIPSRRSVIDKLAAALSRPGLTDPAQRELADFWQSQRNVIELLVERADRLGEQLRQKSLPLVLCHADLHTWNILVAADRQLWIVDWDETVFAPRERDLMFVIRGIGRDLVGAEDTAAFLDGYGEKAIDSAALTYYRYAWAVQDIAAYGEELFFTPHISQESRLDALQGLISLFAPENIVSIALESSPDGVGGA